MNLEEHEIFRNKVRDAITAIAGVLYRDETISASEMNKHFDVIQLLEHEYHNSVNYLRQVESKCAWFFTAEPDKVKDD